MYRRTKFICVRVLSRFVSGFSMDFRLPFPAPVTFGVWPLRRLSPRSAARFPIPLVFLRLFGWSSFVSNLVKFARVRSGGR
jgi:hypothetical protein